VKIIFLSTAFGVSAGGGERSTELLFDHLRAAGHSVYILTTRKTNSNSNDILTLKYMHLLPLKLLIPGTLITDRLLSFFIGRKIKELKPDILNVQDLYILHATKLANKKFCVPCIVTCRNNVSEYPSKPRSIHDQVIAYIFKVRNRKYLRALKDINAIISVSECIKKELVLSGINGSKIHTIYNIPRETSSRVNSEKGNIKSETSKLHAETILLTQGRLVKEKGFDVTLKALALLIQAGVKVKLIIVGDGPELFSLKKLTAVLGLRDFVVFTGWVSQQSILALYAKCDIVLLPSVYPEPFGRGSIEAMSFGKPVVASRIGGIPEAIIDGVNGILIPAGDSDSMAEAVLRLVRDTCLKERMGQAALKILEQRFSSEEAVSQVIKLYTELSTQKVCLNLKENRISD
jgi:glycosyltransferase involved in cell wall biosynthesis